LIYSKIRYLLLRYFTQLYFLKRYFESGKIVKQSRKINLDNCYKIISGKLQDFCSEAKVKGFISEISKGLQCTTGKLYSNAEKDSTMKIS